MRTTTFVLVGTTLAACSGSLTEVCPPGVAACSEADGGTCASGGRTLRVGESDSPDGCNVCVCRPEGLQCTLLACVDGGVEGGLDASFDAWPDACRPGSTNPTCSAEGGKNDGGTYSRCCEHGRVEMCFCPAGMACNYGWFTDCGGGACIDGPSADAAACPRDAGADR